MKHAETAPGNPAQMNDSLMAEQRGSASSETLGVIGLGLLGAALAERALAAGRIVMGFDIDTSQRMHLAQAGGQPLASGQDVARACRCILLALPHDGVTREVLDDIASSLVPGTVIFDATTGDPESAVAFARKLTERGVTYLDTTVSGSSAQARLGEALFMVGGPQDVYEASRDLFHVLAGQTIHTGPCGTGARMKLVTNLVLGLNRAALAEGLAFASALGLDPAQALEVLKASAAYSRLMDTKGEKMLRGDFEPQARLSQHLKDVRLMLAAAARSGQRLPLSEAHRELLELAEQLGLGQLDNSAILRAIEAQRGEGQTKAATSGKAGGLK